MKVYTKTGDAGETSLFGGQRISKSHGRIESYGTIDELNAALGLSSALLIAHHSELLARQITQLEGVQQTLFVIGSHLSTPYDADHVAKHLPPVDMQSITDLEQWIDVMDAELPELTQFILPSGTIAASQIHVARTVARRAERAMIRLHHEESLLPEIMQYMNRLSDYLFVLARFTNHVSGVVETPWKK